MKAKVHIKAAMMAFATMVACTEINISNEPQDHTNGELIQELSITGKDFQFDGATRSSVTIGDNGASFTWDEDDVIGIFPDKGDQVSFAMEEGAGTQTATFSGGGWALRSSATYAAYYPHVYENRDLTAIPVSYLGQTQNGNGNTDHIGAYDFMAAGVSTPENGAVAFDMQHLGALVQLTFTIPEPSTLSKVILSSSTEFIETGTIDLTAETPAITTEETSNTLEIELNNVATTEASEDVTIYFMTAPVNLSNSNVTATINSADGTKYKAEFTGSNFKAGKAYRLSAKPNRIPAELVGLHIITDKHIIKSDGIDGAKISVLFDGVDKTEDAQIFDADNGNEITLIDGQFKVSQPGTYNIMICYGAECQTISITAIQYDIPDRAIDPYPDNTSFVHRAFLTRYTGTGCGYCPNLMKIIKTLEEDSTIPNKAVLAVVHSYNSNDPAYISRPTVAGYPYLTINSSTGFNHNDGAEILKSLINETLKEDAPAGLSVNSILYDNSILVVKACVKAAKASSYKAGIWLLEDNIYAEQSDYVGIADDSYNTHDSCVRYVDDTCVNKGQTLGQLSRGETKETIFVINLKSTWNIENLHFAVTISEVDDTGRNYTTCNVIDCKINTSVAFEYQETQL